LFRHRCLFLQPILEAPGQRVCSSVEESVSASGNTVVITLSARGKTFAAFKSTDHDCEVTKRRHMEAVASLKSSVVGHLSAVLKSRSIEQAFWKIRFH
jgi:hypothetical protein